MRINSENKSVDMEVRDINYILPAYIRSYLFYNKNEMPERIIFPMFPSVTVNDKVIPIDWVLPLEALAAEIQEDGKNIAEVTVAQEAVLDDKDDEIKRLKAEVAALETVTEAQGIVEKAVEKEIILSPAPEDLIRQQEEEVQQVEDEAADEVLEINTEETTESAAKKAFATSEPPSPAKPDRQPKQPPGGDLGPGQSLSDTQPRDTRDQTRTAKDLKDEPDIKEEEEVPFEKKVTRDEEGKPIVEDKPNAAS